MEQVSLFDDGHDDGEPDLMCASGLWGLMATPGIGGTKAVRLAEAFRSWAGLRSAGDEALRGVAGVAGVACRSARPRDAPSAADVRVVSYFDVDYPEALRTLTDGPALLWVRGSLPGPRNVAVVGTRRPTESGLRRARRLVALAAETGWGIVSGLALGIDAAGHGAALDAGAPTWAFLGSGVDAPTPKEHRALADRIVASGGGLLAEVPPGTPVASHQLISRDRLQSGASRATVIVQTGVPSGTLHTARFTVQQGRALWVVRPPDGEEHSDRWHGNAMLLDPDGCDPAVLQATGPAARALVGRRPVADAAISDEEGFRRLLDGLEHR